MDDPSSLEEPVGTKLDRLKLLLFKDELRITSTVISLIIFIFTMIHLRDSLLKIDVILMIFASLYLAALYLCISLGLNMTYRIIGFANFAHAEYFVVGGYIGVAWSTILENHKPNVGDYFIVLILAFISAGLVAVVGDLLVFGPLRKLNANADALMITSIGWGILVRNIISLFFGGRSEYFRLPQIEAFPIPTLLLGSRKGSTFLNINVDFYYLRYQIILAILITLILVGGLFLFLERTKVGKALRATSDNIDLAESSGIDTLLMIRLTWFIGGGLAGAAGVIFVSTLPIIPFSGFLLLLPAFAVITLGGVGNLKGSVVASLIVGFAQTISISYLVSIEKVWLVNYNFERNGTSSYSVVIPFVILILVLLFKPEGLYGGDDQ